MQRQWNNHAINQISELLVPIILTVQLGLESKDRSEFRFLTPYQHLSEQKGKVEIATVNHHPPQTIDWEWLTEGRVPTYRKHVDAIGRGLPILPLMGGHHRYGKSSEEEVPYGQVILPLTMSDTEYRKVWISLRATFGESGLGEAVADRQGSRNCVFLNIGVPTPIINYKYLADHFEELSVLSSETQKKLSQRITSAEIVALKAGWVAPSTYKIDLQLER